MADDNQSSLAPAPSLDTLWKQYALFADLYKAHLELVVKLLTFYYATTGAILSFYIARPDTAMMRWVLGLPLIFSIGFAVAASVGIVAARNAEQEMEDIRLRLDLRQRPSFAALYHLLLLAAITCGAVAFGITVLLVCQPLPKT